MYPVNPRTPAALVQHFRWREQVCVVSIVTVLWPERPEFVSQQGLFFLLATAFIPALGAYPASYPMSTGVSFPGGKVVGA